jgi:hypothetical protein
MVLTLLLGGPAHAFCGTFVGGAGADLYNNASQVALVRQGDQTTLTMQNDFEGDLAEFAVVVPVPTVLTQADVRVVDPAVFDRLDAYSSPRLVEYTCDGLYPEPPPREPLFGCRNRDDSTWGTADFAAMEDGGVQVETQFIVGEYEVVVLSADESLAMLQWLSDQGYAVSPATASMIQEYLDAGSYFFAAKVFQDRMPAGQDELSPLQFTYTAESFGLPIRLGTVNAFDAQDLIVYALTELDAGQLGISNYPQAELDSVCLWQDDDWDDDFGAFYSDRLDTAFSGDEAHWVVEYGWQLTQSGMKCDPCPPTVGPDPLPISDVATLGFAWEGSVDTGWWGPSPELHFTRLHMRYTPEQAVQDLTLYTSGITENTQQRYVRYEPYLEYEFPLCDGGWVDDPGTCADQDRAYKSRMKYWDEQGGSPAATARAGLVVGLLGLMGLFAVARRRV